jgi:hypothetical protein
LSVIAGLPRAIYDFFTEDGSVVIGAVIALALVAVLVLAKPFDRAADIAGPFLFVLIAGILITSLWRAARSSRARTQH